MTERLDFHVRGMDCADEVAALRRELDPVVGDPARLSVDLLHGRLRVGPGTPVLTPDAIIRAVAKAGLHAEVWTDQPTARGDTSFWSRRGRLALTMLSGACLALGAVAHAMVSGLASVLRESADVPDVARWLYAATILTGGWFTVPRALAAVRRLRPDMHLLMTVAVLGAVAVGEWMEGAVVTFLFSVSLALEAWSVARARRAVDALLALAPPDALVMDASGASREVPVAEVLVGDHVIVRPGERVPVDGRVLRGMSSVNQAPITGESLPVTKREGAEVFAGTVNGDGVLEVEVTRAAADSTLARIVQMVSDAHGRRAPSEQWVDRFARVYTPAILATAVVVAVVPPLVAGVDAEAWLYRALVLMVIGCPCALVISTPVSIVAGLAAAARHGVLIKGGLYLELPARLRALAFDKTGTLTRGEPTVVDVIAMEGCSTADVLGWAGALEARSSHPLARAVQAHVRSLGLPIVEVADLQAVPGRGVTGLIAGIRHWVGSHDYVESLGIETPQVHDQLQRLGAQGRTVAVVGRSREVCGFLTLADGVRPEAAGVVQALRREGIAHTAMLTGDNAATARGIADAAGVEDVHAALLPADKVRVMDDLIERFGTVAMVGDGVNDAPAMARASMGIAMGAMGSDAAIEAADVALMSDDLSRLPWLIRHSRRTLRVIRQNVVLSLAVKAVFVALTFGGIASLWASIAADMGVSLVVVANALRLMKPTE